MTRPIKPKRKLSKRAAYELERSEEIARLETLYVEGESNVDWDMLDLEQLQEQIRLFGSDADSVTFPLIPKSEWFERRLAEWEEKRPKVPPGRVQDPVAMEAKYRQKYVEAVKKFVPQAFADLQNLGPTFNRLFKDKSAAEKYFEIVEDLRVNLVAHREDRTHRTLEDFDYGYVWGELKTAFFFAREQFLRTQPNYETPLPRELEAFYENNSYHFEAFILTVERAFSEIAEQPEAILPSFFDLQASIYLWAEKYNLRKDWLIAYAYYFIFQFSQDANLAPEEIVVGRERYHPRTLHWPFEFQTPGWWASEDGESAKQYKARVRKEFEKQLDEYIAQASMLLELNMLKRATKPPTFESVEWLVCWTVKEWHAERIVEHFFPYIDRTTPSGNRAFKSKVKHIQNELHKLEEYDLPYLNKN